MAVTINFYNKLGEYLGDSTMDADADTFTAELYNSTHVFTATNTIRANVSANALATANGYTNPGAALTSVTWVESAGTVTFDAANVTWTASGGAIGPSSDTVVYDNTATNDELVCSVDHDGDQTANDGANFSVNWNASGIFTIS